MLKRAPAPAPVVPAQTERYVPSKESLIVMDEKKKTNGNIRPTTAKKFNISPRKSSPSPVKKGVKQVEAKYNKIETVPYKPYGVVSETAHVKAPVKRATVKENPKVIDYRGKAHPTNTLQMSARDATIEMYAKKGVTVKQLYEQGYQIDEMGNLKPIKTEKKLVTAGKAQGFYSPVHKKPSVKKQSILNNIA